MKLQIPRLNIYQIVLVALTILLVIACIVSTLICLPSLPDKIPTHYGVDGSVDSYGGRASAFSIPIINLLMLILFGFLILSPKVLENPNTLRPLDPRFKPLIAKEILGMLIECGFLATLLFDYMQAFILFQKPLKAAGIFFIVGLMVASSLFHSAKLIKYRIK